MPIHSKIREYIEKKGYISIDELMKQVLTVHPNSYYQRSNTLGQQGDFITSPEISQLFGEIIALWCIDKWEKLGKPKRVNIMELGPGRGMLMRDLLKVAKIVPEFYDAVSIELLEINPHFKALQGKNLSIFNKNIKWLDNIDDTSKTSTLFIANEFFDALPIKQYIKVKETWYESVLVTNSKDGEIKFDKIEFSNCLNTKFLQDHISAFDGAIIEESVESLDIMRFISYHIKKFKGAGLIIDYGYYINSLERTHHQYNPTLQAIKNHNYYPILETLGEADLSAHVDFYSLEKAAKEYKIDVTQMLTQREFLINYGILQRADMLKKSLNDHEAAIIDRQLERLISTTQMGELFKVLSLS